MIRRIIIVLVVLLMAGIANADLYLAVDKPTDNTPVASEVEINGVIAQGICIVGIDHVLIMNVTGFSPDSYTFRVRWHDGSGFWSPWSDPFVAGRTGAPGNVRVLEE